MMDAINPEICREVLGKTFKDPLEFQGSTLEPYSEDVVGSLASHFILNITYTEPGSSQTNSHSYFVKTAPKFNKNQAEYAESMGVLVKETSLFQNLLVPLSELTSQKFAPKCYFVEPNSFIIMEDLGSKNFRVVPNKFFSYDRACSVLSTLACFHASSLIYEEQNQVSIGSRFPEALQEGSYSFREGHPRYKWLLTVLKTVEECLKLWFPKNKGDPDQVISKLQEFVWNHLEKLLEPSKKFRNVITHDDLWSNNMMFRSANAQEECILVDFQLCRYSSPAIDVLTFLYINVEKSCVDSNFRQFVDHYYQILSRELQLNGLEPNKVMSKLDLIFSLKFYKRLSIIEAAMYGTNVLISDELRNKIVGDDEIFEDFTFKDRPKYITKEFEENAEFRERLGNILDSLIECFS